MKIFQLRITGEQTSKILVNTCQFAGFAFFTVRVFCNHLCNRYTCYYPYKAKLGRWSIILSDLIKTFDKKRAPTEILDLGGTHFLLGRNNR